MLEYEGAEPLPCCRPAREPLKLALNVAQKVGLPDYSNIEASMHISAITVDTTDEEVAALVERGRVIFGAMARRLHDKITAAKKTQGWQ